MFASLRNRVVHFKIHGNIDSKMTEKVNRAIKASRFYLPQLVAVSVFSTGG